MKLHGSKKAAYKRYRASPARYAAKYGWQALGGASGAALGYIRNNIPGALAGFGAGVAAGKKHYNATKFRKADFLRTLASNPKYGSRPGGQYGSRPGGQYGSRPGGQYGSNPGHRFGSNPPHRTHSRVKMASKVYHHHFDGDIHKRRFKF